MKLSILNKKIIINRTCSTQTKVLSCSYWWCGLMINGGKVAAPPSSNSGMHHWPVAAWWLSSPRCSRLCDLLACVIATLISIPPYGCVCLGFSSRVVVGSFLKILTAFPCGEFSKRFPSFASQKSWSLRVDLSKKSAFFYVDLCSKRKSPPSREKKSPVPSFSFLIYMAASPYGNFYFLF